VYLFHFDDLRCIVSMNSNPIGAKRFPFQTMASIPLCPFLQRAVLTGLSRGWPRDALGAHYVPMGAPPDWVLKKNPRGVAPWYEMHDGTVLHDTRAAVAFIDETSAEVVESAPEKSVKKRELIGQAGILLEALKMFFTAKNEAALEIAQVALFEGLLSFETKVEWIDFDEEQLSGTKPLDLVICALAPAFSLMQPFDTLWNHQVWERAPKLRALSRRILRCETVVASRCPNYAQEFETFFKLTQSAFGARV
jgi:glutathione S-transferase